MIQRQRRSEIHLVKTITVSLVVGFVIAACSSTTSIKKTGNDVTDVVLQTADKLRGSPYCANGQTPDCFDCSGFVFYCFAAARITVPRTSSELFTSGRAVQKSALAPGDLVFFNTSGSGVSHVGIFIGDNAFIHSSTTSGVIITQMSDRYWSSRYIGARRLL
jgi:cell wall-associated NlpC family hydrolase